MNQAPSTIGTDDPPEPVERPSDHRDFSLTRGTRRWSAAIDRPTTAYVVTAIVTLWVTRSFWWPGRYVVTFDFYTYAGPNLLVTENATRAGRFALWNDAIFGGVTHLGNAHAGTLYLPRLLAALVLENNRALNLLAAVHVVLFGVGMVALVRRLGFVPWAAGFVGVISVLNGVVLTKSMQTEQIVVLAWAPWVLTTIHATLTSRRPRRAIAAMAAVTAATLLAGHPQMVFQTIVLAVAATIGLAIPGSRWRRLPHLAIGVGLGALIALPQVVAAAVATSHSAIRSGRDETALLDPQLSLLPGAGARAVLGTVANRNPAVFVGSFESVAFVGVIVVVLGVVGFVDAVGRADRRPWAFTFAGCGALAMIWSFGPRTFVFTMANDVMPGFDLARGSARWLVVLILVLCVFAGAGIEALVQRPQPVHVVAAASAVVIGALMVAVRRLDGDDLGVVVEWSVFAAVALGAIVVAARSEQRGRSMTVAVLALVTIGSLGAMSRHSFPQLSASNTPFTTSAYWRATTDWLSGQDGYVVSFTDEPRGPEYSVPGLRPNAHVLVGIRSIDGYDGGVQLTDRWVAALRRLNIDPISDLPLRNSVTLPLDPTRLGRLGVRYVLIDRARPMDQLVPDWLGPRATDEWFEVWENPEWVGEAVAWSRAEVVDPASAPALLRERADELAATALVAELAEPLICDATTGGCAPVALAMDRRAPEHVVIASDLDHRTVVTLGQQYDDGWRVVVDGVPADVLEVDGLVVGVDVPAGPHEIEWFYRPDWLTPAIVVSYIAAVLTLWVALPRGVRPGAR